MRQSIRVFPMAESFVKDENHFLPDFCSVRVLFIVVLSAELLAMILTLNQSLISRQILYDLALNSLFIQWIALSCIGLLCIGRRFLNQLSIVQAIIISYGLILIVTFIITEIAWEILFASPLGINPSATTHQLFLLRSLGIAAIIGGVLLRYLYLQHEWRKNIEHVTASRLQALQSRIRPHFLFNCMNTIASLTRTAPEQAEQAVEDLAELFRASLMDFDNVYPITEEWQVCRLYLRIESLRLQERLKIEWDIDDIPDNTKILPLCVQPLIENSIYHGIEQLEDGGLITIKGQLKNEQILLTISNPIPTIDHAKHEGNQLAQENIKQRMLNLYGDDCDLKIEKQEQSYTVSLVFPYQSL
ncbi:MAG: histidine kinase [Pseudomonadota bacterium]